MSPRNLLDILALSRCVTAKEGSCVDFRGVL